jgi:hypothetical protein
VLTVLAPWGVRGYSTGTAQAVLDFANPGARLIFSCGWHITRDGKDVYPWTLKAFVTVFGWIARVARFADLDDQVEACNRIFASDTRWTVVRGSDLEEGESEGLPVWSRHVGDPVLKSNKTRRTDFALFMVDALTNDELIREAPAIVGRNTRPREPPMPGSARASEIQSRSDLRRCRSRRASQRARNDATRPAPRRRSRRARREHPGTQPWAVTKIGRSLSSEPLENGPHDSTARRARPRKAFCPRRRL